MTDSSTSQAMHLAMTELKEREERIALLQEAREWRSVKRDGMPPCDDETVFVGINTAGFACCFNEVTHDGVCSFQGPEICTVQMSGLEWWRVLDRPDSAKESGNG